MNASAKRRRARRGFTLVELLTVVVIIGILASLITAAVIRARIAALNAVVATQIGDLSMAVENYKNEHGEYPPDFTNAAAVSRHLRIAFPRYAPGVANPYAQLQTDLAVPPPNGYGLTLGHDAASALVFWLGGLPEVAPGANEPWLAAGFHADPTSPFKPGLPRTKPLYQFKSEQVQMQHSSGPLRFFPQGTDRGPLVYFRASRNAGTGLYGYSLPRSVALPALGACAFPIAPPPPVRARRSQKAFQIIYAGMDGNFGTGDASTARVTKTFQGGFSQQDYDNIANFSAGTLEDEPE